MAGWRPDLLKGLKVSAFKSYTDAPAITAEAKQSGQYRAGFQYSDGDKAFNIYRGEIQRL